MSVLAYDDRDPQEVKDSVLSEIDGAIEALTELRGAVPDANATASPSTWSRPSR